MTKDGPSYGGISSEGFSWTPTDNNEKEERVTTQRPAKPTSSSRGYA